MSELLAAIPRLFAPRKDDYSRLLTDAEQLTGRAIAKTSQQMNDAYLKVVGDGKKANHPASKK